MATSPVEEKILGRLAEQTASTNALLSASLYQVLGLSILLSRKVIKARRVRKLDTSRDTKSLQLYHSIIWLAREGLSIVEVYILPYSQDGKQGPECRVMATKLRASLYHIICLFHNNPPVSPTIKVLTPKADNGQTRRSPNRAKETREGQRRAGKKPLRDPIPSFTSEASYVTNPFASGPPQTPPPSVPPPPIPTEARRTPTRPPGLEPINISPSQASASFLLPPLNFVPMAREHFEQAQHLAKTLLPPSNALRLSITLEHAAFLRDCCKEPDRARRLAGKTVNKVYDSRDEIDDDEFADAAPLVQDLFSLARIGSDDTTSRSSREQLVSPNQRVNRGSPIDRKIALSPPRRNGKTASPNQIRPVVRTPERLATVPEVESLDERSERLANDALSPPISRLSSRSRLKRSSSATSAKRRATEQAEEVYRRSSPSKRSEGSAAGSSSRQATPTDMRGNGYVTEPKLHQANHHRNGTITGSDRPLVNGWHAPVKSHITAESQ